MKTLLPVTAALAGLLLLAGCSGDDTTDGGPAGDGDGGTELTADAADVPTTASKTYCTELAEFATSFGTDFTPATADRALPLVTTMAEQAATLAAEAPEGLEQTWLDTQALYEQAAEDLPDQLTDTGGLSGAELAAARQDNLATVLVAVGGSFPGEDKAPGVHENAETACGVTLG